MVCSDRELEKQCIDRTSFRKFIGFPEYIPDSSTYGYSERESSRMAKKKRYGDSCKTGLTLLVQKSKRE
jgi:transposase, IS5 family